MTSVCIKEMERGENTRAIAVKYENNLLFRLNFQRYINYRNSFANLYFSKNKIIVDFKNWCDMLKTNRAFTDSLQMHFIMKTTCKPRKKGGDDNMVEETIQTIRETEQKANSIVKDAEAKSREILAEASKKADAVREESRCAAKAAFDLAMEEAKAQGVRTQEKSSADIEKEVQALKELALGREEEAIQLVIAGLV